MRDEFGDRMKGYEAATTVASLDGSLPIYARLDGRSFSRLTRNLKRPFDPDMSQLMILVTQFLVEETHALIGYTQSDEISLVWNYQPGSEPLFGGKIQKMSSVLAGLATTRFATSWSELYGNGSGYPHFDCRVLNLPTKAEATNMLLWRTQDGARNAISMAAGSEYSHKQLDGVSTKERVEMLGSSGINIEDYPEFFKWGTFVRRVVKDIVVDDMMFSHVPEQHRPPVGSTVQRSFVETVRMPGSFSKVSNREKFIFEGQAPYVGWNNV